MIKYPKLIFLFVIVLFLKSCVRDCNSLDKTFASYEKAINKVKSTNFTFKDDLSATESSWIDNAEYFSCDNKIGYLIIETKSKTYIHENVPIETWNRLKNAESLGKFYNRYLKGSFRLTL